VKELISVSVALLAYVASTGIAVAATQEELNLAIARVSSALHQVRLAEACGFPDSPEQLASVEGLAKVIALKKDDLDKSLSDDEFVSVQLQILDGKVAASISANAQAEADVGACDKPETRILWDALAQMAGSLGT